MGIEVSQGVGKLHGVYISTNDVGHQLFDDCVALSVVPGVGVMDGLSNSLVLQGFTDGPSFHGIG